MTFYKADTHQPTATRTPLFICWQEVSKRKYFSMTMVKFQKVTIFIPKSKGINDELLRTDSP
jgi:hypothetical protein